MHAIRDIKLYHHDIFNIVIHRGNAVYDHIPYMPISDEFLKNGLFMSRAKVPANSDAAHMLALLVVLRSTSMVNLNANFAGICKIFDIYMECVCNNELDSYMLESIIQILDYTVIGCVVSILGYATEIGLLKHVYHSDSKHTRNIRISVFLLMSGLPCAVERKHNKIISTIIIMISAGINPVSEATQIWHLCKEKDTEMIQRYSQVYTDAKTVIFYMLGMYKRSKMLHDHRDTLRIIAKSLYRRRIVTCVENILAKDIANDIANDVANDKKMNTQLNI